MIWQEWITKEKSELIQSTVDKLNTIRKLCMAAGIVLVVQMVIRFVISVIENGFDGLSLLHLFWWTVFNFFVYLRFTSNLDVDGRRIMAQSLVISDKVWYISKWYIIFTCPLVYVILGGVTFIGFESYRLIIPYALGYFFVGNLLYLIAHIKLINLVKELKKMKTKSKIKNRTVNIEKISKQLAISGKKFFVKYFYQLKDWEMSDIIDVIEENYTEESKIKRIKSAKVIIGLGEPFYLKALSIIGNDKTDAIDKDTMKRALSILAKETKPSEESKRTNGLDYSNLNKEEIQEINSLVEE